MFWNSFMRLFSDTRRRNVIVLTLIIVLIIMLMGVMRFLRQMHPSVFNAFTQLEAVEDIRSVPGGVDRAPSQEYVKLQKQHNTDQAKQAKKTGRSAISTIVDGFQTDQLASQSPGASAPDESQWSDQPPMTTQAPSPFVAPQPDMLSPSYNSLSPQKAELMRQQMQSAMTQQMGNLFNSWHALPTQERVVGSTDTALPFQTTSKDQGLHTAGAVVKAGNIFHAVLLTAVNSDEPGPVLAKIVSGDLKGARLMGSLSNLGERVLIKFDKLNLPDVAQTIPINAIAVDESTARTALSSHTDRHIMVRYGSLLGSFLVDTYGLAFQRSGERIMGYDDDLYRSRRAVPEFDTLWSRASPVSDVTGKTFIALGNVGSHCSRALVGNFNQAPTVHVYAGTAVGILLTTDLTGLPQT